MLKKFIENSKHLNIYSIVVLQNGGKIAEHHWKEEIRRNQYSITKSFVSTAVGMAVEEGLITLQDKIIDYFKEDMPNNLSEIQMVRLKKLTIEDLLMMATGYEESKLLFGDRSKLQDSNWIKISLSIPLIHEAKEQFMYMNCNAYLAGVIVEKVAGCSLIDYLMPRLFEPLEIERPAYEACPKGHVFGASGLMLTANELSKFGQLYLQNGCYNGKRLISEEWIERASKKHIDTYNGMRDDCLGYGYFFWRGKYNSYYASGKLGQLCLIIEHKNTVISLNANEKNSQEIKDCIWNSIYPML